MQRRSIKGYCFGDFYLTYNEVLYKSQRVISVPPKEMHLLSILVENAGQVVKKEDLIRAIWRHGEINDESLTRCVYALRKLLGENKTSKYIKTLYSKGYIFIFPVSVRHNVEREIVPKATGLLKDSEVVNHTLEAYSSLPKNLYHDDSTDKFYRAYQLIMNDKLKIAIELIDDLEKDKLYSSRVALLKKEIIKKIDHNLADSLSNCF